MPLWAEDRARTRPQGYVHLALSFLGPLHFLTGPGLSPSSSLALTVTLAHRRRRLYPCTARWRYPRTFVPLYLSQPSPAQPSPASHPGLAWPLFFLLLVKSLRGAVLFCAVRVLCCAGLPCSGLLLYCSHPSVSPQHRQPPAKTTTSNLGSNTHPPSPPITSLARCHPPLQANKQSLHPPKPNPYFPSASHYQPPSLFPSLPPGAHDLLLLYLSFHSLLVRSWS